MGNPVRQIVKTEAVQGSGVRLVDAIVRRRDDIRLLKDVIDQASNEAEVKNWAACRKLCVYAIVKLEHLMLIDAATVQFPELPQESREGAKGVEEA